MSISSKILFNSPTFASDSFPGKTTRHILSGTVKVDGTGDSKRIAVFKRGTLVLVAATTSNSAGE